MGEPQKSFTGLWGTLPSRVLGSFVPSRVRAYRSS